MKLTEEIIAQVWERGRVMADSDASRWRQDACRAWICREHFGNERSNFGWKAENTLLGSPDDPANLRPFHWRNSCGHGGNGLQCRVKADREGVPAGEYVRPPRNRDI
jgi:hypothetical protein